MIPGKKYKPEDYLEMAWRRRWVIVVPLVLFAAGAFVYGQMQPSRYQSQAMILIIPPQIPISMVRPTITEPLQERLALMQQQILSRIRLERIIQEFDLYPEQRKTRLMESVIEQMRRDISVGTPKVDRKQDPGYFTVAFESESPQVALNVAERLASLFIRENEVGRNVQTDATTGFLQREVDEALRVLQQHEARLEEFRRANAGRLPSEVETNLQMIVTARQEIQMLTEGIHRDRDRQIVIERTISDELALSAAVRANPPVTAADATGLTAAQQLAAAKAALASLQLKLKDDHPDVRTVKRRVAELEDLAAAEALQQPLSDSPAVATLGAGDAERLRRISQLRAEFESLGRAIDNKRAGIGRAQAVLADHQGKVQMAPMLEAQLTGLMRDSNIHKVTYENMLRKLQEARLASNLEQRQAGEKFQLIDPARRPERPKSPDRARINMIGALMGLGLGLAMAFLLEYRDTSLRSEEDVLVALSLPVVAIVPTLWTTNERETFRRRRLLLIGSSAALTLVASAAAIAWKLRLFDGWIR